MKTFGKLGALLAVFLLAGSLVAGGVVAKPGENKGKAGKKDRVKKLAKGIEKDLKERGKYSEKDLNEFVAILAEKNNLTLSKKEKQEAKEYALREIKKKIRLENLQKRSISRETARPQKLTSESGTSFQLQVTGPISTIKQPLVDINGGSGTDGHGNDYNVEGGNDLYSVDVGEVWLYQEETTCPTSALAELYTMYTLHYYDEDHRYPGWDEFYDDIRLNTYGRIEDIETFYVRKSDNTICFEGIWSNDESFYPFWGQHGDEILSSTSTIYVTVWNHAMDDDTDDNVLNFVSKP